MVRPVGSILFVGDCSIGSFSLGGSRAVFGFATDFLGVSNFEEQLIYFA